MEFDFAVIMIICIQSFKRFRSYELNRSIYLNINEITLHFCRPAADQCQLLPNLNRFSTCTSQLAWSMNHNQRDNLLNEINLHIFEFIISNPITNVRLWTYVPLINASLRKLHLIIFGIHCCDVHDLQLENYLSKTENLPSTCIFHFPNAVWI